MNKGLQAFAYKINMGFEIFLFPSLITLLIALFTVIFQAVKTATANPVDSLRYE